MQKHIILSRDAIWLNKTYGEYISRRENTKAISYILQYEDDTVGMGVMKLKL